jgi:hypothetical protein
MADDGLSPNNEEDRRVVPEILPPDRTGFQVGRLRIPITPAGRLVIKGAAVLTLFGFAQWLLQTFLQLRGVVDVRASRIALLFLWVSCLAIVMILTVGVTEYKLYWRLGIGSVVTIAVVLLDAWAPKPSTQLALSCDMIPMPVAYRAEVWFLESSPPFNRGLSRITANPLKPDGLWPLEESSGNMAYRCTVSNYGPGAVFGMSMSFDLSRHAVIKEKNGTWRDGKVLEVLASSVIVPKPLGPQDAFTFYLGNSDPDTFVDIKPPTFATISRSDGRSTEAIPIRFSSVFGDSLGLAPFRVFRKSSK